MWAIDPRNLKCLTVSLQVMEMYCKNNSFKFSYLNSMFLQDGEGSKKHAILRKHNILFKFQILLSSNTVVRIFIKTFQSEFWFGQIYCLSAPYASSI